MLNLGGKTVAVTGGAGLIGSFLVENLLAVGAKVVVVDDFSTGSRAHLDGVAGRIAVREGDLEKPGVAARCLDGAQVVFHLASRAFGVGYGAKRHLEICLHNERVTNNIVEALAAHPPEFVLTVSSSCVHRDDGPETFPELPIYDGEPERVNSGYGWAKRFMETKFAMLSQMSGVPVAIARPVNVYGERYRWRGVNSQAIPMLVHKVMSGMDPVIIWGSGNQRRNYLHAADCADLLRRIVEAGAGGATVNVGLEETVSISELAATIAEVTGASPRIVYDRMKPEGRFVKSADATRLRGIVGDIKPAISLKAGIARMARWFESLPEADRRPIEG